MREFSAVAFTKLLTFALFVILITTKVLNAERAYEFNCKFNSLFSSRIADADISEDVTMKISDISDRAFRIMTAPLRYDISLTHAAFEILPPVTVKDKIHAYHYATPAGSRYSDWAGVSFDAESYKIYVNIKIFTETSMFSMICNSTREEFVAVTTALRPIATPPRKSKAEVNFDVILLFNEAMHPGSFISEQKFIHWDVMIFNLIAAFYQNQLSNRVGLGFKKVAFRLLYIDYRPCVWDDLSDKTIHYTRSDAYLEPLKKAQENSGIIQSGSYVYNLATYNKNYYNQEANMPKAFGGIRRQEEYVRSHMFTLREYQDDDFQYNTIFVSIHEFGHGLSLKHIDGNNPHILHLNEYDCPMTLHYSNFRNFSLGEIDLNEMKDHFLDYKMIQEKHSERYIITPKDESFGPLKCFPLVSEDN